MAGAGVDRTKLAVPRWSISPGGGGYQSLDATYVETKVVHMQEHGTRAHVPELLVAYLNLHYFESTYDNNTYDRYVTD